MASQQTTALQREESCRYMELLAVDRGEREDDEVGGGLGEKKRRLAAEQVRALERSFEVDNKLDPERKARIAGDLHLHPRQVAVWFQNRRARWKTKQIERDFTALRSRHDALRQECDTLRRDKDVLAAEIRELREKVQTHMAVKLEESADHEKPAAAVVYKVDGSAADSSSSAVFNEEALEHYRNAPASFASSSLLAPPTALSSSFPSMYNGTVHLEQDDGLGGASLFAVQEQAAGISWYGSEGW